MSDKKKGDKKSSKKSGSKTKAKGSKKKSSKKERAAKREARKGDGTFPDILVVTKEKDKEAGKSYFIGHAEDLATLYKNEQVVAVYKLRRVSKMKIIRKVER